MLYYILLFEVFIFMLGFNFHACHQLEIDDDADESCVISTVFVTSDYDYSACPEERWLKAMALNDQRKGYTGAVVINIGFNKGYNIALFMSLFAPATKVTQVTWGDVVKSYFETHNVVEDQYKCGYCGCCGDCKSALKVETQYYNQVNASSSLKPPNHAPNNFVYVGVDLNNENVVMVNDLFSQISSVFNIRPSDAVIKLIHAAGGEKTEVISIPKCAPGDEQCKISKGTKNGRKTNMIDVLVVAIDDLVSELYSANKSQNTISTNFSIYQTRTHDNVYVNEDGNSPTIIDILMIDTEGHDALVLKGAHKLIKHGQVRCIIFEYHELEPWRTLRLEDTIRFLDLHRYSCYFEGKTGLWPVTGKFWNKNYEFHSWSNVMCVNRKDEWFKIIQQFVFSTKKLLQVGERKNGIDLIQPFLSITENGTRINITDNTLLKGLHDKECYIVKNNKLHLFNNGSAFISRGNDFGNVKAVPDSFLTCIPVV